MCVNITFIVRALANTTRAEILKRGVDKTWFSLRHKFMYNQP
jgi:hypothetical protein